jgi:hypothetical protein
VNQPSPKRQTTLFVPFVPFVFFVAPFYFPVVDPVRTLKAEEDPQVPPTWVFYGFKST